MFRNLSCFMAGITVNWQKVLAHGFDSAEALLHFLGLPSTLASNQAEQQFKTRVPRGFAARMQPGDPHDPLLLQVLAQPDEINQTSLDFKLDPLVELEANPIPGLLHKYHGRVLLTLVGACAVNCRYCFRRHFPYQDNNPGRRGWAAIYDYIRQDSSIHEVILSGGDPLLMPDELLTAFVQGLATIPHIKLLRFHTRIPIVLPERIDNNFLDCLRLMPFKRVVVLHANHPNEISEDVVQACLAMRSVGCVVLNQSVLLRGVNDHAETLAQLSYRLFEAQVLPYYLHVLDKVTGAVHFDLPNSEALAIHQSLQGLLPGYLVPKLVREVPGEGSKIYVR